MAYFDGYVSPVREADKVAYLSHTEAVWPVLREFGAIRITEFWGDDVPAGEVTSFSRAVNLGADECVVMGFVEWPSKETRDEAWRRIHEEGRFPGPMPFDGKRMIVGGFKPFIENDA